MQSLVEAARAEIARAANIEELEQIRVRLLGKKGEITAQLKSLGAMDPEARKLAGAKINEAKEALTAALDARRAAFESEQLAAQLAGDTVDVTLPGRGQTTRRAASGHALAAAHRADLPRRRFHRRRRSGDRGRLAQLRSLEHPRGPSGAGDARHFLFRRWPAAAHAYLAGAGALSAGTIRRRCASSRPAASIVMTPI